VGGESQGKNSKKTPVGKKKKDCFCDGGQTTSEGVIAHQNAAKKVEKRGEGKK